MLKEAIGCALKILCTFTPKTNVIFESVPDFSDNTRAVFDELVARGYNKKYKFVWLTHGDNQQIPDVQNMKCVSIRSIWGILHMAFSKAMIFCNTIMPSSPKHQFAMFLDHGTPLKDTSKYTKLPKGTYYLSSSEESVPIRSRILKISETDRVTALGFPRNDVFSKPKIDIGQYFCGNFKKIIVWYPTFRQHKRKNRIDGGNALPLLHNLEWARRFNDLLVQENVLVILKPHYAQDISQILNLKLSNVLFIDDSFFTTHGITSYQFLHACDAMITDYSSVYYDYLLCDNPIGLIWEDIEEYKNGIGLVDEYEYLCKGGEKIYTIDDLCRFIEDVSGGVDNLKTERKEICQWAHYSSDGHSTERVVNYIVEKAGL